ncbi:MULTISPECIES: hypothetical protein [unclassified Duganella]|uniref:hypothetical protein n=1 Tax=unclassified Duganella TaxID=2636909 RepID=UPI000891E3D0|nr:MULTISPECIES: hypothetical protein [unclassified Duganella]SDF66316.1 hypothetical protein SAMN05216320_101907 [Duganella sp. OV458]SDI62650.1 hypothetical protein SAMN05428973_101508 [Duganella sp. OV510]
MSAAEMKHIARPPMWRLEWDHGSAEVQALGGMLGPLHFRLDAERDLQVMHVAPWAGTVDSMGLPGMLRRMRGEWPCVPFGRTDLPPDLPQGWTALAPDDRWPHGYASNHRWRCKHADQQSICLEIDYPEDSPVASIERHISVVQGAAALDITLTIHPRRSTQLPAGLHPTFRLPQPHGRVTLELGRHEGIYSYPSSSAGAVSRLLPDTRSAQLNALAGIHGPLDLSRLPLTDDGEELLQVRALTAIDGAAPFSLHYQDYSAHVGMWWNPQQFPDLMLWLSNRGRPEFPWQSRHVALGAEPVNSVFDLSRVAQPPAGHPLSDRLGILLQAGEAWTTRYRIAAWSGILPAGLAPDY